MTTDRAGGLRGCDSGPAREEADLRRALADNPFDLDARARLGLLVLSRGRLAEAIRCFEETLAQEGDNQIARLGQTLAAYVVHGKRVPLPPMAGASADLALPQEARGLLDRYSRLRTREDQPLPAPLSCLQALNLTAQSRLRRLTGEVATPPLGRHDVLDLVRAQLTSACHRSTVLVLGLDVDPALVWEWLPHALADRHPGTVWELAGSPGPDLGAIPQRDLLASLEEARIDGHRFLAPDAVDLLAGWHGPDLPRVLGQGTFLALCTAERWERLQAASDVARLRSVVQTIAVTAQSAAQVPHPTPAEVSELSRFLGRGVDPARITAAWRLADRFVPHVALPEAALLLLQDACRGPAQEPEAPDLLPLEALVRSAARLSRLPTRCVGLSLLCRAEDLGPALQADVGIQQGACATTARAVALAMALEDDRLNPATPARVLAFLGAAGSGKAAVAKALSIQLFGAGRYLEIHAGSGQQPVQVSQPATRAGVAPFVVLSPSQQGPDWAPIAEVLEGYLLRYPHCVIHLTGLESAGPAVLDGLRCALATARLRPTDPRRLLRHSVVVLGIDGASPSWVPGRGAPEADGRVALRLPRGLVAPGSDGEWPGLRDLVGLSVPVVFRPLEQQDYVQLVALELQRSVVEPAACELGVTVSLDESVCQEIARALSGEGPDPARLEALVTDHVVAPLWTLVRSGASGVVGEVRDGQVVFAPMDEGEVSR